jgi:hypothetical protein
MHGRINRTSLHACHREYTYGQKIGKKKTKMASCLPSRRPLALAFSLLLIILLPLALGTNPTPDPVLTYHGGPLLTGKIDLAVLWYGQFGNSQKKVIRSFIKSLNYDGGANFEPQVSSWWQMVGSYQSFAGRNSKRSPGIKVQVARQVTDKSFSLGKVLTVDNIKLLVQKATAGNPNSTLAVIFTSRQVTASDLCMGKCSEHGVIGNTTFPPFLKKQYSFCPSFLISFKNKNKTKKISNKPKTQNT